jgi:hypothetical protein
MELNEEEQMKKTRAGGAADRSASVCVMQLGATESTTWGGAPGEEDKFFYGANAREPVGDELFYRA